MKKLAAALLVLVACGGEPGDPTQEAVRIGGSGLSDYHYRELTLPDGRTVPCVIYSAPNKGGISCDWDRS